MAKTDYRGRFAPSPTGRLHFGSLLAAVASHARARSVGGVWLVRIDDLDPPREVAGAAQAILSDLGRFGMRSDEPVLYQSSRGPAYAEALERLAASDLAFACGCSRRDLAGRAVYPGTCANGLPRGRKPRSVRLRVAGRIEFDDRIQGRVECDLERAVGAFVIRRADGLTAYHLACVVDDAYQGITESVRGADLLDSTPAQVYLQRCLGLRRPEYAHIPVAVNRAGNKLSKQTGARALDPEAPLPALRAAWRVLGQDPPPAAIGSVAAFWDWAIPSWRLDRVPRTAAIVCGGERGLNPQSK